MTKPLSYYMNKNVEKLGNKEIRIALLSSYTINGLASVLKVKCHEIGIDAEISEAGYDQIRQEAVNPQGRIRGHKPEMSFMLINERFVFRDELQFIINTEEFISDEHKREDFARQKADELIGLVKKYTANVEGMLIMSTIPLPSYSSLGINEERVKMSAKDIVKHINHALKIEFLNDPKIFLYDINDFIMDHGLLNIVNDKLNYIGDILISPDYLVSLGERLMSYIKPFCAKNRKCIVLDMDNTLWGGIVGEDGFDKIALDIKPPGNVFYDFQKHLLALQRRGVILALCSKNNPDDALQVVKEHPYMLLREECFAAMRINWFDKATNIKELAKEINIGADSMIFFDDDPLNRSLVREQVPEVLVPELPEEPAEYVRILKSLTDLSTLQLTKEDFKKGEMYYQQKQRSELLSSATDMNEFLKGLGILLDIKPADKFTIPRISQMTKKTNQFNCTTRRYSEEDINCFAEDPSYHVYGVNVRDKFGDNGITGLFILEKKADDLRIDTFLLSCRVIGRNVEKIMLHAISSIAKDLGVKRIVGEYFPTKKNKICTTLYSDNGFTEEDENHFVLKDFDALKPVDYIDFNFVRDSS